MVGNPSGRRSLPRHLPLGLMAILTAALLFSGCMLGPNFKTPDSATAEKWRAMGNPKFLGDPIEKGEWWKAFNDPVLDSLIEKAFQQNQNLHIAALRVVQARIGRTAATETLFPMTMGKASRIHTKLSQGVKPDITVSVPTRKHGAILPEGFLEGLDLPEVSYTPKLDIYSAGFDAAWELDLWGAKRRGIESAAATLREAYASYDDMMVSLAGEVGATYVQIRSLQARLQVLRQNMDQLKKFEALAEERYARKESPETDVHLAKTLGAIVGVAIPALEDSLRQAENALCVLLGMEPQDVSQMLGEGTQPMAPLQIAVGAPADLLRRRPDVRMAEAAAHAQCARIGKAKASILPSFSLLGSLGWKASDSQHLFESASRTYAYGGSLNATQLLNYPFFVENIRNEDAKFQQAILDYQVTVLNAAREVEDAMYGFLISHDKVDILTTGSLAAARSTELAVAAYGAGKVIISVPLVALTFQASLQDQLIAAKGSKLTQAIAMYKALGGGWEIRLDQELVPEQIQKEMKDRSDWWSFAGKIDLRTAQKIQDAKGK